jgi:antitoxin VapB
MDNHRENSLHETRQTFKYDDSVKVFPERKPASNRVMRVKVFKSGNSLALRLPASLGLEAGMEMNLIVNPDGGYTLEHALPEKRKIDVSGFWGKAPGVRLLPREDFEERPSTIAARKAAKGQ